MQGDAFVLLASALVGLTDADLEVVVCAAAGVLASRNDATTCAVLGTLSERACVSSDDVRALVACGVAGRDQLEAEMACR